MKGFSQQVEAYDLWKSHIQSEVDNYKRWLKSNDLASEDVLLRIERGLALLDEDQLTIAIVGEYSRGKTELINALVFAEFGQRMLPSQAGRTTMCPTEVFYDTRRQTSYLRLLPIETRTDDRAISELKIDDSAWHEIPIDVADHDQIRRCLEQVANKKIVSAAEANRLGFESDTLELVPGEDQMVYIPEWRHALISVDNPLLRKGLRVLDTPGLNALGSEPELTLSMIPKAHAVLFMLSADAGVTASDMSIWVDHIDTKDSDHRAGRFALLNKIDVLWDDPQGDAYVQRSIENVRQHTAQLLKIETEDVLPISAKQGLIGRVKNDPMLLQRSSLVHLEKLISKRILSKKQALVHDALLSDLLGMLENSQQIISQKIATLYSRFDELENATFSKDVLKNLADKARKDHELYHRKLITVRSSRRLMHSQGAILQNLVSSEKFNQLLEQTKKELRNSWSTLGMNRAMSLFFMRFEEDVDKLVAEAKLADKMVSAIYMRFSAETKTRHLRSKPFSIRQQTSQLKELKNRSIKFRRNPRMLLSEQTTVIKNFFTTFITEARSIHESIFAETIRWPEEALLPLLQYTLEQKKMLEKQVKSVQDLASKNRTTRESQEQLQKMIDETNSQLKVAETIHHNLQNPPVHEKKAAM